jgi:F-type H+-transporting ATPase subunit delta
MTTDRSSAYAQAVVALATAEDALGQVADELLTVARAVDDNDALRQRLSDVHLPVANRLLFVESEVLKAAAHPTTRAVLAMLIAADRGGDLSAIAEEAAEIAAHARDAQFAEVRVAVALDDERRQALVAALEEATGLRLDVNFIVDESVVGGVRARIGDTVIDGSIVRRLNDLRARAAS